MAGVATFGVYAAGMALPLLGVAVALALGKDAFIKRIRGAARYTTRVAGGLLVLAGSYIVFYWATVLNPGDGGRAGDTLVTGVETLSSRLTNAIGGNPVVSALVLVAAILAAAAYVWRSRRTAAGEAQGTAGDADAAEGAADAGGTERAQGAPDARSATDASGTPR